MEWLTHFISRTKRQKPLHGSTICNVQEGNVLSSHVIVMVLGLMTVKQKQQLYANQKVTILKSNTNIKHVSKAPFSFNSTIYMMPTNRSPNFQRGTINQKHHPDLGSDASSVWNFCTRFVRRHLAGKPVVASPNVGCFLRLTSSPPTEMYS